MGEWVSVEEALPEIGLEVLISVRMNSGKRLVGEGRRQDSWETKNLCGGTKEGDWIGSLVCSTQRVTHWMPLPTPPPEPHHDEERRL